MSDHRAVLADEFLAEYAGGTLPPGLSLLTAAHLTFSPEARARVAEFEAVGGALLEAADTTGVSAPSLATALSMLDAALPEGALDAPPAPDFAPLSVPPQVGDTVLPRCLSAALGVTEHDAPWKFLLPGLHEAEFEGFGEEEVSLLRAAPGAPIFQHTHEGVEATLILCGAMEDRGRVYRKGEVNVATPSDDHRPRILDEGTCICFVVNSGALKFTGRFSRVLNYLAE